MTVENSRQKVMLKVWTKNWLRSASLPNGIAADFFFIQRSCYTRISESTENLALLNNPAEVLISA